MNPNQLSQDSACLGGRSRIFLFFCSGAGEREEERRRASRWPGGSVYTENKGRGVLVRGRDGGGTGAGGVVCGEGGKGAKDSFGAEIPTEMLPRCLACSLTKLPAEGSARLANGLG